MSEQKTCNERVGTDAWHRHACGRPVVEGEHLCRRHLAAQQRRKTRIVEREQKIAGREIAARELSVAIGIEVSVNHETGYLGDRFPFLISAGAVDAWRKEHQS